jgi:hypothetical protein
LAAKKTRTKKTKTSSKVVGGGGGGDNRSRDGRKEGLQAAKQPVSKRASEEVSIGAS